MKLFFIRYTKLLFIWLQLHRVLGWLSGLFANMYYLTLFSKWAYENRKVAYNDFPCKWDYQRRLKMYEWVIQQEGFDVNPINYLEFGVAWGESFKWWLQKNNHAESSFYGFDTFDGLPEDWGPFKKGAFSSNQALPDIGNDNRARFLKGLFQQTLPEFVKEFNNNKRNVIMMDADLFSATLYTLTTLAPYLKKGDIIFFDEFVVPTHEFKAYQDFIQSYYCNLQLIAAANNYYFVAFKVI